VLILLHGLGDSHTPFTNFARSIALPETVCISLQGLAPLPFDLGGQHWGDDIVIDHATGDLDVDAGFTKSVKIIVENIISTTLIGKYGFKAREVLLFGFGQGGYVALSCGLAMKEELGGIVSVGGILPSTVSISAKKNNTPIIVCKGMRKSAIKDEDIDKMKQAFNYVEIKEWPKTGDGMPTNREEMLPIMQFFARRLRSVRGVPADAVEISSASRT